MSKIRNNIGFDALLAFSHEHNERVVNCFKAFSQNMCQNNVFSPKIIQFAETRNKLWPN